MLAIKQGGFAQHQRVFSRFADAGQVKIAAQFSAYSAPSGRRGKSQYLVRVIQSGKKVHQHVHAHTNTYTQTRARTRTHAALVKSLWCCEPLNANKSLLITVKCKKSNMLYIFICDNAYIQVLVVCCFCGPKRYKYFPPLLRERLVCTCVRIGEFSVGAFFYMLVLCVYAWALSGWSIQNC